MEIPLQFLLFLVILLLIVILIKVFTQHRQKRAYEKRDAFNQQFIAFTDRLDSKVHDMVERNTRSDQRMNNQLVAFQDKLRAEFVQLQEILERRLTHIDQKVNENLEQGFEKTNRTFTNIVERLSKIDAAQKKIDALSTEIVSLQDILTDKKTRGTFGEVQLSQIMRAIFGEKNDAIYRMQYTYSNGTRSDAVLFAPEPLGTIAIDSKFPLENYRRMMDKSQDIQIQQTARKAFVNDCKHHIDAIASKYIIAGETSDQALLFIPAEAIFAEINAYHEDILEYSYKKRVWITSPTTLMSTLTTIQTILVNLEREKYAAVIHDQLRSLSLEFNRYRERWGALAKKMEGINDDFRKINTTTHKITKRFDAIANVENTETPIDDSFNHTDIT